MGVIRWVVRAGYLDVGYPVGCPGSLYVYCVSMLTVFLSAPGCCWAAWARSIGAAATCVVSGLSGALFIGYSAQIYILEVGGVSQVCPDAPTGTSFRFVSCVRAGEARRGEAA